MGTIETKKYSKEQYLTSSSKTKFTHSQERCSTSLHAEIEYARLNHDLSVEVKQESVPLAKQSSLFYTLLRLITSCQSILEYLNVTCLIVIVFIICTFVQCQSTATLSVRNTSHSMSSVSAVNISTSSVIMHLHSQYKHCLTSGITTHESLDVEVHEYIIHNIYTETKYDNVIDKSPF